MIYFADHRLYGEPHIKQWVLIFAEDDPSPDAKVRIKIDLDMFEALDAAKAIEAAKASNPKRSS